MEQSDMKDKSSQQKPKRPGRDSSEFRVVEFNYNPGPDAEDRLRRLFTILLKHAARDRLPSTSSEQAHAPEKDSPSEGPPTEDHPQEEG